MKNTFRILVLMISILALASLSFSQWNWTWRNPTPTGDNIYDIWRFSAAEFLAVGDNHLMRTTDAGATWSVSNIQGEGVFFVDADNGWICCGSSVAHTTDHGASWKNIATSWVTSPDYLTDVCFVGTTAGWACGTEGIMLKSTDGGDSWNMENSGTGDDLHSLYFTNANVGYAVGDNGTILKTATGGSGWNSKSSGTNSSLNYICPVGSSLFAFGDGGTILKSTDAGSTWSSSNSGLSGDLTFAAVVDANNIWVVGLGNVVYKSTDGGTTWVGKNPWIGGNMDNGPTITGDFSCACFSSSTSGIVCGNGGVIYQTTDDGNTWKLRTNRFSNGDAVSLTFSDSLRGCLLTDTLFRTSDGGATWVKMANGGGVKYVHLFPNRAGIRLMNSSGTTHFETTTDGGATWATNNGVEPSGSIFSLKYWFTDVLTGYGIPWEGTDAYKTTNGGTSWTKLTHDYIDILGGVAVPDANTIWLTEWSDGVNVLLSTDGGGTWTNPGANSIGGTRSAIFAFDSQNAWIGTVDGLLNKTIDGGKNFAVIDPYVAGNRINDIRFVSSTTGFVAAADGIISVTTDGGSTWSSAEMGSSAWTNISSATAGSVYLAGAGGNLIEGTAGAFVSVRDPGGKVPSGFALRQNYPNPFNPSTSISFQLPSRSFVSLKIFDAIGREVGTLVHQELEAGDFTWHWDASQMPSGIYFCRLQSGSFTETRKLVLIK